MDIKKIKPVFTDDRGSLWDLLTNENIEHIGFLTSKQGSIRAKHFHKKEKQYTLILKGKAKIIIKNLLNSNSSVETFELQQMEMILIPPYHYHSVESITDTEILFFSDILRANGGYEIDTTKVDDIESFKLHSLENL